jgi:hypothetical protein
VKTVGAGEGRFRVEAALERCGDDLLCRVSGGERPHVGAAALAQYEPERQSATVSVLTAYGHRDDAVAARFAKALAAAGKCTAAVSAGLHVDSAGAEEIALLRENAEACLALLLEALEEPI